MNGSSYPHDGVPGQPASESYARNVDDRCVTTDCPSTPFQSTTAQTSIQRTGEGYLYLSGNTQKDIDTNPVGSRSGTYGAGSGDPARGGAIGYKSYTLANALQEIPAEKTSVTQASPPSAPPAQEIPPISSPPSAPMVEPTAPLPMMFTIPASSPEVRPDPTTTVLECLQGPPLKFKCPLGCDVELAAQVDGLSQHLSDYHKNLLENGWMVNCPVPGCTATKRWANFYLHLLAHLKKLRGDYVWCRDCDLVMKAKSAPRHLATPRHENGNSPRSTSKGEATRKIAPRNPGGKSKPRANSSNAAKQPARPRIAPSGPPGSLRWT